LLPAVLIEALRLENSCSLVRSLHSPWPSLSPPATFCSDVSACRIFFHAPPLIFDCAHPFRARLLWYPSLCADIAAAVGSRVAAGGGLGPSTAQVRRCICVEHVLHVRLEGVAAPEGQQASTRIIFQRDRTCCLAVVCFAFRTDSSDLGVTGRRLYHGLHGIFPCYLSLHLLAAGLCARAGATLPRGWPDSPWYQRRQRL